MTKARSNAVAEATKGDLSVGTGTNLAGILAVGTNGDTLVADSSTTTGLRWQGDYAAGKNAIINGNFGIWQRGTSFTNPTDGQYVADRFLIARNGTGATRTVSQQTFTPGTAPVAGYEGTFFLRAAVSVAGSGETYYSVQQKIEDVRTFAGQTATISFWAKADASRSITFGLFQSFGSGGSGSVFPTGSTVTLTTSWVRYSHTIAMPSIAGKTIGTGSSTNLSIVLPLNSVSTIDIWGVQVEAGSVATAFQTATGTIQGELAACQRYYWRQTAAAAYSSFGGVAPAPSTTNTTPILTPPVTMRVTPTSVDFSTLAAYDGVNVISISAVAISSRATSSSVPLDTTVTGATQFRPYYLFSNNSASAFVGLSSELQEMTMDNVTFIKITDPLTDEIVEHAIIDRGNGEYTSMTKAHYEAMQAEQSTPNLAE